MLIDEFLKNKQETKLSEVQVYNVNRNIPCLNLNSTRYSYDGVRYAQLLTHV
jgi:hypothetical protein